MRAWSLHAYFNTLLICLADYKLSWTDLDTYLKDVHEDTHSAGMCIFLVMQLLCFQSHLALFHISGDALIDKCYGLRCTALRLVLYEHVLFYVGTFFEK